MNHIIFQDIKKILKSSIRLLKTEINQRIIFKSYKYKNAVRPSKTISTSNHNIHINNSTSIYREWITYLGETDLSKDIQVSINNKYIKFLRIIFPNGIRSNKEIDVKLKIGNSQENKRINNAHINKTISIKAKDIKYFRNLFHLDIEINDIIKEINITKQNTSLSFQKIEKVKSKPIKTIYIILDAINYDNFIQSKGYKKYLNIENSYTFKAFAPSTVTGSSLPSLITLQPVLTHMIGDYNEWFYSPKLECLPPDLKTIAEILKDKSEYSEAYTSFSKSMPFYNYYRGFNIYNSRCTGNNYSPSAVDLLNINLLENSHIHNQLNSSFLFAHDIGGHPPVFPNTNLYTNKLNSTESSYNYSIEISLNKVNSLINQLKSVNQFDNTNIIITSDHTESYPGFSKDKYHLYPSRIKVPIYIKTAQNINHEELIKLNDREHLFPSSFLLSKLINIIYNIDLNYPQYSFKNICWLSSVYKYPLRELIYTLGFDNKNQVYISVIISTDILKNKNNKFLLEDLEIYYLKDQHLLKITNNIDKNRIKNSFESYVRSCRKYNSTPSKQGDQIFI